MLQTRQKLAAWEELTMEAHVGDKIKRVQEELRAKGVKYCIGA